ncbi:unnamed protein product, partial [Polarella glacialis]
DRESVTWQLRPDCLSAQVTFGSRALTEAAMQALDGLTDEGSSDTITASWAAEAEDVEMIGTSEIGGTSAPSRNASRPRRGGAAGREQGVGAAGGAREQSRERPDRISTTARPTREFGSKTPVGASGPIGGSAAFAAPSPKEGKQGQGRGREVREQIEDDPVGYRVFVGQLHPKVQQADLQEVFEKFG